jgi:hypothetical protein
VASIGQTSLSAYRIWGESKRFFFEKKKQKTFALAGIGPADATARSK